MDTAGSPIAGARVLAVPSRTPVPPKLEEATTIADGTFLLDLPGVDPIDPIGDITLGGP